MNYKEIENLCDELIEPLVEYLKKTNAEFNDCDPEDDYIYEEFQKKLVYTEGKIHGIKELRDNIREKMFQD